MFNVLIAIGFGAGVAAFAYSTLGRRAGYGNNKEVMTIVGVVFVIATIVFYTVLTAIIKK